MDEESQRESWDIAKGVMTAASVVALLACAGVVIVASVLVAGGQPIPDALRKWTSLVLGALIATLSRIGAAFEKRA
jgi:hypothetical protein